MYSLSLTIAIAVLCQVSAQDTSILKTVDLGMRISVMNSYANADPEYYVEGYATYQSDFSFETGVTSFLGIRYAAPPVGMFQLFQRCGIHH